MVILFEWHLTAVDRKNSSGLPMTGEDTGLEALASPLAGYLGKVQERAASLEDCPWCTSKGLSYALRSYHINLQESITLCTNPQCLFPLVSRSLEDVLATVALSTGNKRKKPLAPETDELIKHSPKRLRSNELDTFGAQGVGCTPIHLVQHCALNNVSSNQYVTPKTDGEKANGSRLDLVSPGIARTEMESLHGHTYVKLDNPACIEDFSPSAHLASAGHLQSSSKVLQIVDADKLLFSPDCGALGLLEAEGESSHVKDHPEMRNRPCSLTLDESEQTTWTEQNSLAADITMCKGLSGIKLETEDLSFKLSAHKLDKSEELVSVPNRLFWWNSDNLCWLDSLLVALVNCKSLRSKPEYEPQQSPVWQLMRGYEDIYSAIQAYQQPVRDGIAIVPNHVLQKANADLQNLRMSVFKLLEPKLHCKLGQRETPVFALPLLLKMDSWVEPLFQSTFHWELKCSECNTATKERVVKTLPTFTNIIPEWHPLHAVHLAPCNTCFKKSQRRTMILERVPPVFVLHFVEGLPDNDVRLYTFNFKGKLYSVTTVIQYNHQLKHFVTWVCNSDGSWLEYDGLKHPDCKTHQKLPVPAQEMHIVFWEVAKDKEPSAYSLSSTCADSPPSDNEINPILSEKHVEGDELLACTLDQSLVMSHNDTDIVCAFSVSEDNSDSMDTTVMAGVDRSIGSTTLLDTFEGLSHNDIITLTLVELKPDSERQALNGNDESQYLSVSNKNEILDTTPDSSSAIIGSEVCQGPNVESATTSNSSDPESIDNSSSDPTFVPCARRGQRRGLAKGKAVTRTKNKKAASSKAVPHISPPASSEPSNISCDKPLSATTQHSTQTVETTKPTSPVSSTETSSLSTSQINPTKPIGLDPNARWSFLLSKHPQNLLHKSMAKLPQTHTLTSAMPVTPTPPRYSTPSPMQRQQTPGELFHKPQLRTDESVGLPLKSADTYVAFGAKNSNTLGLLPSPALHMDSANLMEPIASHQLSLNTTVLSGTTLSVSEAKRLPEIFSLKKHGSQSSKVPSGLSKTDALRLKLIKKLKAKKKALAKLNKMLGHMGETSLRPDSTDLSSPNTVSSSTYNGSTCDDFLSHLLSPATTASNLSPDSTGLQEILASGQAVLDQINCGVNTAVVGSQTDTSAIGPSHENFLEEFFSQAVAEGQTEMESEALSALEMFM